MQYQYIKQLTQVLEHGLKVDDRTGVGTLKYFGQTMKFDVSEDKFPILTTKFVHFKSVIVELLWMLSGNDNTNYLKKHGVSIWDEWADEDGSLNGVYGKQWRQWSYYEDRGDCHGRLEEDYIDQVNDVIHKIKTNPNDRRQLVCAWNVGVLDEMNLPPCHFAWQTFVRGDTLDLSFNMRSVDSFLGKPFDLALYSLLLCILAKLTNKKPGQILYTGVDCHIYLNHIDQCKNIINRFVNGVVPSEPQLKFSDEIDFTSLESFLATTLNNPERIYLENYNHMGKLNAPVAI